MSKTKPNKLLNANTAVSHYLDNLLQEATELKTQPKRHDTANSTQKKIHVLQTPLTKEKCIKEEDFTKTTSQDEVKHNNTSSLKQVDKDQLIFPAQCLMFKVSGHLVALPLIKMGSVVPFGERLTQLPHSPSYFKGLLKYRDKTIKVADLSELLMGIVSQHSQTDFKPSHLLVFENEEWAVSCDELLDVVTLNEDEIQWHSESSERLSLGTIKTSLALILNPDAICKNLVKGTL